MSDKTLKDGRVIRLLKVEELKHVPAGTVLLNIFGEQVVVGDDINTDTRGGYLALGVLQSLPAPRSRAEEAQGPCYCCRQGCVESGCRCAPVAEEGDR